MANLLELRDFHYYYGNIHAVKGIDLYVDEGEIVTIIGANGAGKSTTLKSISGLTEARGVHGEIIFNGENIAGMGGHKIAAKGIMQVLEGRHVFSQLSVYENLIMGAFLRKDTKNIKDDIELQYKRFPRLKERENQMAGTLSGGEQQMLAIARAMINRPKVLLMDEPSLGLAPIVVRDIFESIKQINKEEGTTILLVEQNSKIALNTADRGYVLQTGEMVMNGRCEDLLNDEGVKAAYLGAG